jgi:hypothetical protein
MAFGVNKTGNGEGSNVDFKALNLYMVDTCKLESPEALTGTLSGIQDMGNQPMDDAAMLFEGGEAAEAAEMEKNPLTYFETMIDYQDGRKEKRFKRWPVKDTQTVGLTIDFTDIHLDKGQFFGNDSGELKPLRMIMGGEYQQKYSSTYPLNIRKNDKTDNKWSMLPNSLLYRMAVDSKIIKKGDPFLPEDIDKLLGKEWQFNVMIAMKGEYLNETIKYMGPLGRNANSAKLDEKYLFITQFNEENTEAALGMLTNSAVNTMKQSPDWADSKLAAQYAKFKGEAAPEASPQGNLKVDEPQEASNQPVPAMTTRGRNEPNDNFDSFDDDIPF